MRARRSSAGQPLGLAIFVTLMTAVLWQFAASGAGAQAGGELTAEPSFGAPAETFLGASPLEASGEVWATAKAGNTLARYTDSAGWETVPAPLDLEGRPLEGLEFATETSVGRTTPRGGVVVVASGEDAEKEPRRLLVVRDPGGALREAPEPPSGLLEPTEAFLQGEVPPATAALEGPSGETRALVVPSTVGAGPQAVLSLLAGQWSREPICIGFSPGPACAAPPAQFRVLAIEASGGEAWLLARGAAPGEGIELFRREATGGAGGTPVWRQQSLGPAGSLGSLFAQAAPLGVSLAARSQGQPLTVSQAGVWVDAQLTLSGVKHEATAYYDIAKGELTGSWCDLESPAGLCTHPLEVELPPGPGRSFAWPPQGSMEPFGQRVVTGVGQGAILNLAGSAFERIPLVGGEAGSLRGAALSAPDEGWLGEISPLRLSRNPPASSLQPWPVPFRRPLTAVAPAPGAPVAGLGSEALAVGAGGEVARYLPGQGWEPEFLLTSSGKRAAPNLRGVAWPEPGRAFAVGDGGAMWVWQRATGLWQSDPAEPATLVRANFTGIAFEPGHPSVGYAVGKQGLLLRYGRTWTQERLPAGVPAEANFTSIAFAGDEALATYKFPQAIGGKVFYTGGVIVNDGSGWRVDQGAEAALGGAIPQRVAGLPDGGAAIATGETRVFERESASASWQRAPGGSLGYPVALALTREGGDLRAIVSIAEGQQARDLITDQEQALDQPPPGQPPLLIDPYPLPGSGVVLRQTAVGWRDEQHQTYPLPSQGAGNAYDLPGRPDPVLALLVDPSGGEGWALGGETGSTIRFEGEAVQTADVMRFGPAAAPPSNAAQAPIGPVPGVANFAIGGDAQCAGPCADLSSTGIAPVRWVRSAVGEASGIGGLRAFLYSGPGVAAGGTGAFTERLGATLSPAAFGREEAAYAQRLGSAAGSLPTFAAPAETDLDRSNSLSTFQSAFSGFGAPFGSAPPGPGVSPLSQAGPGTAYYSFSSSGSGGTVRVIVLDYSFRSLGEQQKCWLAGQLSAAGAAGTPAIVLGERDLARQAPNAAEDAGQVVPILVNGSFPSGCAPSGPPAGASAYFFDYPGQNRTYSLVSGGRSIPAFGSGTLGYVAPPQQRETDFVGAGGFLLAAVNAQARNPTTNVAPVSVRLIPDIGSLALNATDGTLLRRSRPALFEALARRPDAGSECIGSSAPVSCESIRPDPYVPIPSECHGARCATAIFPEYTFTSSNPDIADFVEPDPASLNPRNVHLVNNKPVLDSQSGLLCAFNAGTTTVTVTTGGFSYSQKVTVLAGTVQQPCGTTPLRNRPVAEAGSPTPAAPPPPAPAPAPAPAPVLPPPPPPPSPPPAAPPAPPLPRPVQPPVLAPIVFLPPAPAPIPIVPIVPPPPAPALPPTPPSGTSPVSATEREEEEEEAYESAHQAVAVRPHSEAGSALGFEAAAGGGPPRFLPGLALLLAIGAVGAAGAAGIRRTRGRRTTRPRFAHQSNNTDFRRFR